MKQEFIILEEDKAWARQRIAWLEQAILDLGPEFHDVFNQSSETWHDNAPFDALRDRQSVLDAELQQLKRIMRRSRPGVPPQPKTTVDIGSVVELTSVSGETRHYKIAGDWTPHAGKLIDGLIVVSLQTPLATELLAKRVNDTTRFGTITSIH